MEVPQHVKDSHLTGHTLRVLYLSMSPDGQTVVSGAGDETLRFWSVFPGAKSKGGPDSTPTFFSLALAFAEKLNTIFIRGITLRTFQYIIYFNVVNI